MPPLAFLAVIGAGAYVAWRAVKAAAEHMARQPSQVPVRDGKDGNLARDLGVLEYDPISGVYKPRRGD